MPFVKNTVSAKPRKMRDACRATSNLEVRDQREQEAGPGRRNREKSLGT